MPIACASGFGANAHMDDCQIIFTSITHAGSAFVPESIVNGTDSNVVYGLSGTFDFSSYLVSCYSNTEGFP